MGHLTLTNDLGLREKLMAFGRYLRPRPKPSPAQGASGSRWLHSPQKVWLWMQQCTKMAKMGMFHSVSPSSIQSLKHSFGNDSELRKRLSILEQPHLPHPTLPLVQGASDSRWLHSPQKVWAWMRQCIEVTRMGKLSHPAYRRGLSYLLACCRAARKAVYIHTTASSSFQTFLNSK